MPDSHSKRNYLAAVLVIGTFALSGCGSGYHQSRVSKFVDRAERACQEHEGVRELDPRQPIAVCMDGSVEVIPDA